MYFSRFFLRLSDGWTSLTEGMWSRFVGRGTCRSSVPKAFRCQHSLYNNAPCHVKKLRTCSRESDIAYHDGLECFAKRCCRLPSPVLSSLHVVVIVDVNHSRCNDDGPISKPSSVHAMLAQVRPLAFDQSPYGIMMAAVKDVVLQVIWAGRATKV